MSRLWYNKQARNWNEALPIGNGRLGAMIFGNPYDERIQINEETLWSGYPGKPKYTHKKENIDEIRSLLRERKYAEANEKTEQIMPGLYSDAYLSLGHISIEMLDTAIAAPENYARALDMENAVYKDKFSVMQWSPFNYERECFTSFADDVMVYRFHCNWEWNNIYIRFSPLIKSEMTVENGNTLVIRGKCPVNIDADGVPEYDDSGESVGFTAKLKVITNDKITAQGDFLHLGMVRDFTAILSIGTSFNGFDKLPTSEGKNAEAECDRRLNEALKYTYDELKARHTEAYKKEYGTNVICFSGESSALTTDIRIENIGHGELDPELVTALYDYGKYLLLCSSRNGGQAANLQGIWTRELLAPWRSNYTMNINAEMNYWAAEQCGLSDCHMPFLQMIYDMSKLGNHFGYRGWNCCHNTDIWRFNAEATKSAHGMWEVGGIWACRHIYEHFSYTNDMDFLRKYFPVLEGADAFLRDFLITDSDGYLTTSPSESPENAFTFDGKKCQICTGAAMDLSLISDFYKNMAELAVILGKDDSEYIEIRKKLKPLSIGKDGRLLEWNEDFEETEKGHRHISHLVGYFPCNIYDENSPYFTAMRKSLEYRLENGGGGTGWSNAWIANMYVRMCESETAYGYICHMFEKSMYPNMLDAHTPFQIDGNFGICCAISEMIVQSHRNGVIELLPACPKELGTGHAENIYARGGYRITMTWNKGMITEFSVYDKNCKECSAELLSSGKLVIHGK